MKVNYLSPAQKGEREREREKKQTETDRQTGRQTETERERAQYTNRKSDISAKVATTDLSPPFGNAIITINPNNDH